jgi:hypothetical protein
MSARRARARRRKRAAVAPRGAAPPLGLVSAARPRREAATRRSRIGKVAIASSAILTAALAMALARLTYAGHAKHAAPPLVVPQPLYDVVRQNLLQAGILAPATAPSSIVTGSS